MYHLFTLFYIILFLIKLYLLKTCDPHKLGDRILDVFIVCSPALMLVSEWLLVEGRIERHQHRPFEHVFDMLLQSLFVGKVLYKLSERNAGRIVGNFIKGHLCIGPSIHA